MGADKRIKLLIIKVGTQVCSVFVIVAVFEVGLFQFYTTIQTDKLTSILTHTFSLSSWTERNTLAGGMLALELFK